MTEQLAVSADEVDSSWQAQRSCKFSHAHIEHTYYLEGPSRSDGIAAGVHLMLAQLLSVLKARKHLLHVMTVRCHATYQM